MQNSIGRCLVFTLACCLIASVPIAQEVASPEPTDQKVSSEKKAKSAKKRRADAAAKAKKRAEYLRVIMTKLDIGDGATVADIGAGDGRDSWVFADVVGTNGKVYSEEIAEDKVKGLKKSADEKKLFQVQPVLGKNDDPGLPADSVDMAFMHYVYHHFSQPREMLVGLWKSLKPGGYLVIVDRRLGTLQDWVPREVRAKKHHWLAETTVVREAREEGFAYIGCAEDCWPADDQFVLVFQRPKGVSTPGCEPDPPLPLDLKRTADVLFSVQSSFERPVFVALGQARELMEPILKRSSGPALDVILEEWATQKEERPVSPVGVSLPSTLTEKGSVALGDETLDAVFFLDTYHRLFHHEQLLAALHEKLTPAGRVFILDRKAENGLSRREASHQRKISVEMVKEEMRAAGFRLLSVQPPPASDRMLLVFGNEQASGQP